MKYFVIGIGVLLLIAVGSTLYTMSNNGEVVNTPGVTDERVVADTSSSVEQNEDVQTENNEADKEVDTSKTVIGVSADGNEITAHHYGAGDTELLFVGGTHGGYSWNTVQVAREMMLYLNEDESAIPDNLKVTVIPLLNPDGLETVVGTTGSFKKSDVPSNQSETIPGRFNGNNVDLNRNFDCEWQAKGTWKDREVSGGSAPFSEPEAQALRDYVNANTLEAVVVWYSSAGGVYASNCNEGVLPQTSELTKLYATAAGYSANEEFDFYEITGDMVNWLAKENIPAISVLLTNADAVEWDKNKRGVEAMFELYKE